MRVKLAPTLLLLTWAIFFSRTLFLGQVYFLDDLKIIFYPLEHVYGEFQRAGELPEWSPLFGFGHPLLAWGQLGFFTPVHVVLRFFGLHPLLLLQASILIYFLLGLIGMYWFLRRRQLASLAAALGAVVYVFCGFNIGHLNHVNFYVATMVVPWLLVAIDHFFHKQTLKSAALLALPAAAIAVSAHAQMALYALLVGALYGIIRASARRQPGKHLVLKRLAAPAQLISLTLLAGILALSLASFAILPLFELLPYSDRAGALPKEELYEFSYPLSHAITLIAPYYFGDHEHYWGAKNFQELAAYVGIIPLALAGWGLIRGPRRIPSGRHEYWLAVMLLILSLAVAPGKYSPVYLFLVENNIITSLAIPGRFVFFFDTAVAPLAAMGLSQIRRHSVSAPLAILAAANLLYFGWNYNPLSSATTALSEQPLSRILGDFKHETGLPARLLSRPDLLATKVVPESYPTEQISPTFSVHQPITVPEKAACLMLPIYSQGQPARTLDVALHEKLGSVSPTTLRVRSEDIESDQDLAVCFPELATLAGRQLIISFSAPEAGGINLYFTPNVENPESRLYFVRKQNPTPEQLVQSRKELQLEYDWTYRNQPDPHIVLMSRHLQATAGASSAQWISAFGLNAYRSFISLFFANDDTPVDGDGVHFLSRYRTILNMSGITHLAQIVPGGATDLMPAAGFLEVHSQTISNQAAKVYRNPTVYPRAFLVGGAVIQNDDQEVKQAMSADNFDPRQLVYLSEIDPRTLVPPAGFPEGGSASITAYQPTQVTIATQSRAPAVLVLTDA